MPDTPATSPWGTSDQVGAANELNPERTLASFRLVRSGRVYDLSQALSATSPRLDMQSPFTMCMWTNPIISRTLYAQQNATNAIGFADERVEFDLHTGTHIDALGHTTAGDYMYNGIPISEGVGNGGLNKLGIENVPPVCARGILIDVRGQGPTELRAGQAVTAQDLQVALRGQSVNPGDVVLIRTGWSRYYGVDNPRYVASWPGITLSCAQWLASKRVIAIGADTMGLEVIPEESPSQPYPVHQFLLAKAGVYIIEQANLEELAHDEVTEFLCLCLPVKFKGGTASPIRLVGVV